LGHGQEDPAVHLAAGLPVGWLRGDLIAGLTVWAVLVPEALAYTTIAGVSPVVGLYAAPAALLLYAAFGSSRHLVTGPMAATAALSAAAVAGLATAGSDRFVALTTTLGLMVGIIALLAGLLRRSPPCWACWSSTSSPGLFIGIAVSFLLLYQSSCPHIAVLGRVGTGTDGEVWVDVERHPGSRQVPGVVVLRVEGGLFFADAEAVSRSVRAHAAREGTRVVVLDAGTTVPFIDVSAARMLGLLAGDLARRACGWCSPATSARCATSCAAPRRTRHPSASTPPSGRRSRRSREGAPDQRQTGASADTGHHPWGGGAAGGRTSGAGNDRRRLELHSASSSMRGR
jgi:MFS superfamily sulfate permease-like transporter